MQRAFQFKRQMIIPPAASIVFAGVSIVFAIQGYGAWAMVIGWYASTTTAVVLSWWMAKWHPFRGRFSFRIWREMAGFSLPLFLAGLAERARETFEQVIVGRALGIGDLGQYRYAYRLASLPSQAIITICSHVLFPAFSRISDDSSRFRAAFLRALGWIWFAALPIGALLVVAGQPVVVLLLGEVWRPAGAAAAAMAGIGLGTALDSVGWEAIKGAGRSSLLNWLTALHVGLGLPLIVLLLPFGLVGSRHRTLGGVAGRRLRLRRTRPLGGRRLAPRDRRMPLADHALGGGRRRCGAAAGTSRRQVGPLSGVAGPGVDRRGMHAVRTRLHRRAAADLAEPVPIHTRHRRACYGEGQAARPLTGGVRHEGGDDRPVCTRAGGGQRRHRVGDQLAGPGAGGARGYRQCHGDAVRSRSRGTSTPRRVW